MQPASQTSKTKNVTLSLPEGLLRRFKVYAAQQERSMSSLLTEAVEKMTAADAEAAEREACKKRFWDRINKGMDLGTHGKITWTREDIYEERLGKWNRNRSS